MSNKRLDLWGTAAMLLGYNELAKQQTTLGQKLFCNIARKAAENAYRDLGGEVEIDHGTVVLVLKDHVQHIEFTDRDVALMRKFVAELDAKTAANTLPHSN